MRRAHAFDMDPALHVVGGAHKEVSVTTARSWSFDIDRASIFQQSTCQHCFGHRAEESIFTSARFVERFHEAANLSPCHSTAAVSGGRGHPREDFLSQASNING
jgi:hypothetical protein